jgi:hypothetical protein
MNAVTLSSQQLKSLVEDKWQRDADAFAVGLHVANAWLGPNEVEFGFGKAQVVRADTVFQVREALRSAEQSKDRIILLTRLQQGDLGHDVVARLARSRLFTIDQWASLCALFKAKELDRSVCDPALAQALLDCAPADGYPPVSAGLLDAGTVWRAVCRHVFDMGEREPDLVTLLLWATSKAASTRFLDASDELQASLRQRLRCNLGDAADSILRFVESGAGADALALAVVCQVVFGDGSDSTLEAASARMEQFHNNKPISLAVGRVLGRTAVDAIADLDRQDDARLAKLHLDRADSLLQQLRCTDHTYRNRLTLRSYEQRMARFGDQITTAVASPSQEAVHDCERLQREIIDHRIAKLGRRAEQISRTEMAIRLVRWLSTGFSLPQSFSESANVYRKEIAFVDWARESVCRGDDVPELTKAYLQLDQAVLARREEFNRAFAQLLRAWTGEGSTSNDVCGVEDVLSQTVAQAAKADNRVLLIVLDGMSWAVCHELLKDIRQEHWFEATLDESSTPPTSVVATIPSVTRYSRTSLLSGVLASGDSFIEKRNFEANAELKQVCDKKYPPVLFHKSEVTDGSRGAVAEDLQKAILTPSNRVVGLVINAIDDTLSSAQQVRHNWNIDQISLLGPVLKLARDSGRVVIMASDHGHVWHRPDAKLCAGEAGTRWRHSSGEVQGNDLLWQTTVWLPRRSYSAGDDLPACHSDGQEQRLFRHFWLRVSSTGMVVGGSNRQVSGRRACAASSCACSQGATESLRQPARRTTAKRKREAGNRFCQAVRMAGTALFLAGIQRSERVRSTTCAGRRDRSTLPRIIGVVWRDYDSRSIFENCRYPGGTTRWLSRPHSTAAECGWI